jgi:voltage-gated potassium channel
MRLQTWERRTDWPLTVLAVVFLGCYAWPILDPDLDGDVVDWLAALSIVIWIAFAADYLARLYLADQRWDFVRWHVADLGMLVLPMLRPLRALRAVLALSRVNRQASSSFRGQSVVYIAGTVPLVVFVAALAMLDAERGDSEANITSFHGCDVVGEHHHHHRRLR